MSHHRGRGQGKHQAGNMAAAGQLPALRKDYDEARAELKVKLAALDSATADTWADAKDQASKAWDKVEAAYNKAVK